MLRLSKYERGEVRPAQWTNSCDLELRRVSVEVPQVFFWCEKARAAPGSAGLNQGNSKHNPTL